MVGMPGLGCRHGRNAHRARGSFVVWICQMQELSPRRGICVCASNGLPRRALSARIDGPEVTRSEVSVADVCRSQIENCVSVSGSFECFRETTFDAAPRTSVDARANVSLLRSSQ